MLGEDHLFGVAAEGQDQLVRALTVIFVADSDQRCRAGPRRCRACGQHLAEACQAETGEGSTYDELACDAL